MNINPYDMRIAGACWSREKIARLWGEESRPYTDIFSFRQVSRWDKLWVLSTFAPRSVSDAVSDRAIKRRLKQKYEADRPYNISEFQKYLKNRSGFLAGASPYGVLRHVCIYMSNGGSCVKTYLKYYREEIDRYDKDNNR